MTLAALMRDAVRAAVGFVLLSGFVFAGLARGADDCQSRLLVLSAMPIELGPFLAKAEIDDAIEIDGRSFYVGTLEGKSVILALTGIGIANAEATTRLALDYFGCSITGVVFSGTSGGASYIGDVTVAEKWTLDGTNWFDADAAMRDVAKIASTLAKLSSDAPIGDAACTGQDPDALRTLRTVHLTHEPEVIFDGNGHSSDPFGGHPLPCIPGGGDVFGCKPCRFPDVSLSDVTQFASGAMPFLSPDFFTWYSQWSAGDSQAGYVTADMETAAVASVVTPKGIPFIAFRGLSDGLGDPLMLPGFPLEFFFYRQLAADNAASVTLAFLAAWPGP